MSKTNPDNKTRTTFHPRFSPETQAVRSYLATNATTPETPKNRKNRPHRVGEAAYMETTHNRQRVFAILFQISPKAPETRGF
jgi:hypothetical protein